MGHNWHNLAALEVVIVIVSSAVIIQCLGASCGHVFPLCSLFPSSFLVRLRLLLDSTSARWLRSLFVRSGNIFIMMPTGPKVLRSVHSVVLCMLTICMPEMINVSTPANLLTSVHAPPVQQLNCGFALTLIKRFSLHLFIVIFRFLYACRTQVVSIGSNYCHIQLFLSVYYTYNSK